MPNIPNPAAQADAFAQVKQLETKLAEAEAGRDKFKTASEEAAASVKTLTNENTELKDKLAQADTDLKKADADLNSAIEQLTDMEKERDEFKAQAEQLAIDLSKANADLEAAKNDLEQATEAAKAAEDKAEDAKDRAELISDHLQIRSIKPEVSDVGGEPKDNSTEVLSTWLEQANSDDPAERRAARKARRQNAQVAAAVSNVTSAQARKAPTAKNRVATVSPEDQAVYDEWKQKENEAGQALRDGSVTKRQANVNFMNLKIASKQFRKDNFEAIERVIAAQ